MPPFSVGDIMGLPGAIALNTAIDRPAPIFIPDMAGQHEPSPCDRCPSRADCTATEKACTDFYNYIYRSSPAAPSRHPSRARYLAAFELPLDDAAIEEGREIMHLLGVAKAKSITGIARDILMRGHRAPTRREQ